MSKTGQPVRLSDEQRATVVDCVGRLAGTVAAVDRMCRSLAGVAEGVTDPAEVAWLHRMAGHLQDALGPMRAAMYEAARPPSTGDREVG